MNYLAHLYLSGSNEDVLVGNYIADGIKGEDKSNYKPGVIKGVQLHKKIDDFTDTHPIFKTSAKRLTENYGHYAWVIVDIYYDHFLANNWNKYTIKMHCQIIHSESIHCWIRELMTFPNILLGF